MVKRDFLVFCVVINTTFIKILTVILTIYFQLCLVRPKGCSVIYGMLFFEFYRKIKGLLEYKNKIIV